jgi:hypothetical protein
VARDFLYCLRHTYGTGAVITVDGGAVFLWGTTRPRGCRDYGMKEAGWRGY